jgi:uncharacterized membrane protein YfbV (UPF0208 family)
MMQSSLMMTLQQGMHYSKTWPLVNELNGLFPENKMIRMTRFGQQVLPALSVLSVVVQVQWLGQNYLAQALASALFLLSLPLQGWYWLGARALSPLPPSMLRWYLEISDKLRQHGVLVPIAAEKPCYQDLASVLNLAASQLDKAFIRQLL